MIVKNCGVILTRTTAGKNRHKPGSRARSKNRRFRQGQGVPFILDSIQALKRFFGKLKRQKKRGMRDYMIRS